MTGPKGAAEVRAGLFAAVGLDFLVRAWDGTEAGPPGSAVVVVRSPRDPLDPATDGRFDAVASVEMGEHAGTGRYPWFCAALYRRLRPGGRLLIQQMSRAGRAPGGGPFIESSIAPVDQVLAVRPER